MHTRNRQNIRRLWLVLVLSATYMIAEIAGGLVSRSLALLADAGHMAVDTAAVALGLFAFWVAKKPPTDDRTFGYYRAEILAALTNGATLIVLALFIFYKAWTRIWQPVEIRGLLMGSVALGGLVINLLGLYLTHQGHETSLNMRGVFLHILGDTLGSVLALVAAFIIWRFQWYLADPLLSILLSGFLLYGAGKLVAESVNVLLEGCPQGIDTASIKRDILSLPQVKDIHDFHVWAVATGVIMLSAHVKVASEADSAFVLETITSVLRKKYQIKHATVQIEPDHFTHSALH